MAKIQKIGHDHLAPFWGVAVGFQAVTQGKNKLPHAQYTSDTQSFYRFGNLYRGAGGGIITDGHFGPPKSKIFLDTLDLSYHLGNPWVVSQHP